ncbi:recombination regulator RecX [Patescibacteria group bacterium]|nr:recombination regulator RecX [Patescibacteria group bacterium]
MPTIAKLKSLPSGHSCWVEFSNQKLLRLPLDLVVKEHLTTGLQLSLPRYRRLLRKSIRYRLKEYALNQIALSPKTEFLLRQKLKLFCLKHHLQASRTIEFVVKIVKGHGFLDNEKFVNHYLAKFPRKSLAMLKFELAAKGVPRPVIDSLVRVDPASSRQAIFAILRRRHATSQSLGDLREKNRILSAILRKGFTLDEAKSAIDEYLNSAYNKLP